MAIWQFDLFIVPREGSQPVFSEDGWQLPQWSAASTLDAQRCLVDAFGCPWLMMEDWVVFGCENETRVDLLFDGADEVEIQLRLAVSASELELGAVCAFAVGLDGLFFNPATRAVLEPNRLSLAAALETSRAAKFSNNPRAFFAEFHNSPTAKGAKQSPGLGQEQTFEKADYLNFCGTQPTMTTPNTVASSITAIPFKGMVTGAEFARVQRLMVPWWASPQMTALWILFSCVYFEGWIVGALVALPVIILVCAAVALISRAQWRRVAALQQEINGTIGDAGVGWNTAMTTANFPWQKIVKVNEHPDLLLLFYSGRCAFYMPKRFFSSDSAWQNACALAVRRQSEAVLIQR
jgi:hypothetical protein